MIFALYSLHNKLLKNKKSLILMMKAFFYDSRIQRFSASLGKELRL
ncbi:hypothetical protein SAMN05421542_3317 [Chryseobacterium jejuense]|uniref:Uncharacterized protein n=1 Tax=Chryseobacterium jejuense TaxID=445960 RepID=A0A2X2Z5V4_CHRJE|nr:hypothetical protein SAMN05421542_3317 [Chryseobacterium jejuense]SQB45820.1 Uncharacterised protein [Chryseobacterium jejuense]